MTNQPQNPNNSGFPNVVNAENQPQSTLSGNGQANPPTLNQPYSHIHTQQLSANQTVQISQLYQNQRQKLLFTLTAVLTGATLVVGVLIYAALKSFDTTTPTQQASVVQNDTTSEAPIETSASPIEETQILPQETIVEPSTQAQNPTPIKQIPQSQKFQPQKNLGGTNWRGRDLRKMNLRNVDLGGANLETANLSGVDLSGARLGGANLAKANLRGANLSKADLRGANLGDANLTGANLSGTLLDGANLNGTIMP